MRRSNFHIRTDTKIWKHSTKSVALSSVSSNVFPLRDSSKYAYTTILKIYLCPTQSRDWSGLVKIFELSTFHYRLVDVYLLIQTKAISYKLRYVKTWVNTVLQNCLFFILK